MRVEQRVLGTLAALVLLVSGLGCQFASSLLGGEIPTPGPPPTVTAHDEPTPLPTEPPPFRGEAVSLEHPFGGVSLEYPADWVAEVASEGVVLAESRELLEELDLIGGAVMLVVSGPTDEITEEFGAEADSRALLEAALQELPFADEVEPEEVTPRRFANQEGVGVGARWVEQDALLQAFVGAYVEEEVAALVLAVAPEDEWEVAWSVFDSIMSTAVFYAPWEAVERGSIRLGEPTGADLDPGGTDRWVYDAPGETYVTVGVEATGDWDPALEVFDPGGDSIGFNDDSGGGLDPRLVNLRLPVAGQYHIHVSTSSGHGGYRITVSEAGAPAGGSLSYGETVEGVLGEGERQEWTFQANAGDAVSISMVGFGDLDDTYLELYGPDGVLLVDDDDSGEGLSALIGAYLLMQTGTHRIVARGFGDQGGAYVLTIEQVEVEEEGIAYGETASGELTGERPREYWVFDGAIGDVVTISMIGLGDLDDTYLELYGPDGGLLIDDDDSGDGFFALVEEFELPESGTYWVMARAWGTAVGAYQLTVERVR